MTDFGRVRRRLSAHQFEHPDVARFVFDVAEGAPFDPDAFLDLVADPYVFPMRFTWLAQESAVAEPADGPSVNDAHGGEFVNLAVLALRCGHGPALFAGLTGRPRAQADPVMAMLATIGRADCRAAAAKHFGLPDLPGVMNTAFAARPTLDDMLRLADYGRDHPRFAEALAGALARWRVITSTSIPTRTRRRIGGFKSWNTTRTPSAPSSCFFSRAAPSVCRCSPRPWSVAGWWTACRCATSTDTRTRPPTSGARR